MTNPPDHPRDDRRMHEGDKKGLGDNPTNAVRQDDVTPDIKERDSAASATTGS